MNVYYCGLAEQYIKKVKGLLDIHMAESALEIQHKSISSVGEILPQSGKLQVYFCVPESMIDGLNGIEFARNIRLNDDNAIIIFLSNNLLATVPVLKKFICPAGYYLYDEIKEAILLVQDVLQLRSSASSFKIEIVSKYRKMRIPLSHVVYFTSANKKIICNLMNGKSIEFYSALADIEQKYGDLFIRCHSSYLINKQKITSINYTQGFIEVQQSEEKIPISRKYRADIKAYMQSAHVENEELSFE